MENLLRSKKRCVCFAKPQQLLFVILSVVVPAVPGTFLSAVVVEDYMRIMLHIM